MRLIGRWLVFPILFALYPILHLYATNVAQVSVTSVLPVLTLSVVTTIGVLMLSRRILGDDVKAALFAGLLVVVFFSYAHFYSISRVIAARFVGVAWASGALRHRYLVPFWGVVLLIGTWVIVRTGERRRKIVPYLNVIAAALVALALIEVAVYRIQNLAPRPGGRYNYGRVAALEPVALPGEKPATLRDIYYIILDGYGRQDILRRLFSYENQEFIEFLKRKAFYVASRSRANYPGTIYSVASTLNMTYLDDMERQGFYEWESLIENSRLEQFLKAEGYTIVRFSGPFAGSSRSRYADVTFRTRTEWWSEFAELTLSTTMLDRLIRVHSLISVREHTLFVFEKLAEIPRMSGPKFVFAHILVPQDPFVFDRNGNSVSSEEDLFDDESRSNQRYIEQLIFVNKKVERLVDELIRHSDVAPIILIAGDHGPPTRRRGMRNRKYFGNLMAYYLPAGGAAGLYASITPVNSFRVILDHYFGTQMGLLEDKSYFFRWGVPRPDFSLASDDVD